MVNHGHIIYVILEVSESIFVIFQASGTKSGWCDNHYCYEQSYIIFAPMVHINIQWMLQGYPLVI